MAMIFPGMDPYLERPALWPGFHNEFMVYLRDQLQPGLRPRYIAAVEARVYIEGGGRESIPDVLVRHSGTPTAGPARERGAVAVAGDEGPVIVRAPAVEVSESYLTILDRDSGQRVVTVIELLSPSNKRKGPGRTLYRAKQRDVLRSRAHLVEIDLLRTGRHTVAVPEELARSRGPYDYLVCVSRARRPRDEFELYPRSLRRPLPTVLVPLAGDDPDLRVDLNPVLARTYEAGAYGDRTDYSKPCVPPLSAEDQAWADDLIRRREAPAEGR